MLNKVILIGNIGYDPEFQTTQDGRPLARFSVATSSTRRDALGEWHKHTDWHRIVVYKETTIRWITDTLKKGARVRVEGKLTYQRWKDKGGQQHRISYIVVSGSHGKVEQDPPQDPRESPSSSTEEIIENSGDEDNFEAFNSEDSSFEDFQSNQQFQQ